MKRKELHGKSFETGSFEYDKNAKGKGKLADHFSGHVVVINHPHRAIYLQGYIVRDGKKKQASFLVATGNSTKIEFMAEVKLGKVAVHPKAWYRVNL